MPRLYGGVYYFINRRCNMASKTINTKAVSAHSGSQIMDESMNKMIDNLASSIVRASDKIAQKRIRDTDFDKTLIGTVIDKDDTAVRQYYEGVDPVTGEKIYSAVNMVLWTVSCNGTGYRVWQTECDITSIGQQVRLYIPNNNYSQKYAEVIDTAKESYLLHHPKKCKYNHQTKKIVETWQLDDGTEIEREYQLYIRKDSEGYDEVYKMDLPDSSSIELEGFFLDKFN